MDKPSDRLIVSELLNFLRQAEISEETIALIEPWVVDLIYRWAHDLVAERVEEERGVMEALLKLRRAVGPYARERAVGTEQSRPLGIVEQAAED